MFFYVALQIFSFEDNKLEAGAFKYIQTHTTVFAHKILNSLFDSEFAVTILHIYDLPHTYTGSFKFLTIGM